MADNQLSWNVLLFSCNLNGQLCLSGPSYSSHTVINFKKLENQFFPNQVGSNPLSLTVSFVVTLFLEHLGINKELSLTASSKRHDCVTAILFQANIYTRILPEQRVKNQPIRGQHSSSESGKSQNNGLVTGPLFFCAAKVGAAMKITGRFLWD